MRSTRYATSVNLQGDIPFCFLIILNTAHKTIVNESQKAIGLLGLDINHCIAAGFLQKKIRLVPCVVRRDHSIIIQSCLLHRDTG